MFSENSSPSQTDGLSQLVENMKIQTCEKPIPSWLLSAESPFNWQPQRFEGVSSKEVIAVATEKAEYDDLLFDKFIQLLTLVYEYSHLNNIEDANTMMMTGKSLLDSEMEQNNNKCLSFMDAMRHVQTATHAHLLAAQGLELESKQESEKLVPVSTLSSIDQAAVHALKAKFFSLYKEEGLHQAVESARKALQLNPEEPIWMFLLAESLRKEAKYSPNPEIPREELELLDRAVQKDRNPRYLVHLAFRYNNCANKAFAQHKNEPGFRGSKLLDTISKMQDKATKLCKEAIELAPNDETVNRRCGFVLMKADYKTTRENRKLIKTVLEKALKMAPDSTMTLHYLGKYYRELENNSMKAQEYFEQAIRYKSTNTAALWDLMKIKFEINGIEYDPTEDLNQRLEQSSEPSQKIEILCQMLAYQLLVKQNLAEALNYFQVICQENADHTFLMNQRPFFLNQSKPYDLCEILANEIMRADEVLPQQNEVIEKLNRISPKYLKSPINNYLIETMMKNNLRRSNKMYTGDTKNHSSTSTSISQNSNWRSEQSENNKSWRTEKQAERIESKQNWRSQNSSNQNRNCYSGEQQRRQTGWKQQDRWSTDQSNWRKRTPDETE